MTPTYTQVGRQLTIETPLGPNALLIAAFRGHEAISEPFSYELELLAERATEIPFDRILGQKATVTMCTNWGQRAYFSGLVRRFTECGRDENLVAFRAEVVPDFWLLKKRVRSRIFQSLSAPDILRQVLAGFDLRLDLLADYYPRDYCVQYRESDFDFASRLMEEEGIYYYFTHSQDGHQMVLSDKANGHPEVPGESSVVFEPAVCKVREEMCVKVWEKSQELRSTEYTVWDHWFQLPGNHLDDEVGSLGSIRVGQVTHQLNLGGDPPLEIYDYPGGYARRFDAIDHGGAERPSDITHLFLDRGRTARVRMEGEEAASLEIAGSGDCANFTAGHLFTLHGHFDADGGYVLKAVEHEAHIDGFRSGEEESFRYENRFKCIPRDLPYRPPRVTPRPVIAGVQTATVVGPQGTEIFCDKYGRVKVQFHWDREGSLDEGSSCWVRVAQLWAGNGWGSFFWPRIGHEVVVAFEDGDPDQPLIVGSLYNARNMPAYELPQNNQLGGIRSATVRGRAAENFNGIVFNDELGTEHLSIHSERSMSLNTEFDKVFHAGGNKGERVAGSSVFTVGSLPDGGGSGGGGVDWNGGNAVAEPVVSHSESISNPQAVQMVYGASLASTIGLGAVMGLGDTLLLCLNPVGLPAGLKVMPDSLTGLIGAVGGYTQFNVGTCTTVTVGHNRTINVGSKSKVIEAGYLAGAGTISVLTGLLLAISAVWAILYARLSSDKDRAISSGAYQLAANALVSAIMVAASKIDALDAGWQKLFNRVFGTTPEWFAEEKDWIEVKSNAPKGS